MYTTGCQQIMEAIDDMDYNIFLYILQPQASKVDY
jgi:hypothetical protein